MNKKIKIIKLGPKQTELEEPFVVHIEEKAGKIKKAEVELGFLHRGIERLATKKNFYQNLGLVERICGYCSFTHSLAYVGAVEDAAEIVSPARARYIRTIVAEIERLHSHILWLSIITENLGFKSVIPKMFTLREGNLAILQEVTGGRIMYEINTIGGVLKDIKDPKKILKKVDSLLNTAKKVKELFEKDKKALEITKGLGVLTKDMALELGVVGPTARASGILMDVRKDFPYAAYKEILNPNYITLKGGDCYSRIYLRFLEIIESFGIIKKALTDLPNGEIIIPGAKVFPQIGVGIGRVEAPRGELFHFLITDSTNNPARLKVRPPSYVNLQAIKYILEGEDREKAQTIISSLDPCFSCTER